ncbi:MAG: (2Fe-2S) ferredoxin domain-containing protein [Bacteroidales bacterium]
MDSKKEIIICLGSSCFARGNKQTVKIIGDYIKKNNLENEVFFHGNHCFGKCDKGPFVKIDGIIHENINSENILIILDNVFKRKK